MRKEVSHAESGSKANPSGETTITLHLEPELRRKIHVCAAAEDVSDEEYIRDALRRDMVALVEPLRQAQGRGDVPTSLRTRLRTGAANGTNGEKPIPFRYPVMAWVPFILSILLIAPETLGHTFTGRVTRVIDGDTIVVSTTIRGQPPSPRLRGPGESGIGSQAELKVRLAEIDAPEMKTPFGPAAKKALAGMIEGKVVVVQWKKRGRYRRIIGTVYLERGVSLAKTQRTQRIWINGWMVEQGWAWLFKRYSKNPELARLEKAARAQGFGIFKGPTSPTRVANLLRQPTTLKLRRSRGYEGREAMQVKRLCRSRGYEGQAVDDRLRCDSHMLPCSK